MFPRNFIYRLYSPYNYIGLEKVFGFEEDEKSGLPVIIPADELFPDDFITESGRKTTKVRIIDDPESLKYAIRCFVLSSIIKDIRKTAIRHNTMLVHVDRLTSKQSDIQKTIIDYMEELNDIFEIETPRVQKLFLQKLNELWEKEFRAKKEEIYDKAGIPCHSLPETWSMIEDRIPTMIKSIVVKTVNGKTLDALDYENHKNGLNVIAIGGDKLARGLTLEGLTISYFVRNAGAYDTLTQMGRWFGYRDNYLDVCRIITTHTTFSNFREIAFATHDLYQQFDDLCKQGNKTPLDYGLRVLTNPKSKLLIVAKNKAKATIKHSVSFSGSPIPTAYLPVDNEITETNLEIMKQFINSLGTETGRGSSIRDTFGSSQSLYWSGIPSNKVINGFLKSGFVIDKQNSWFSMSEIAEYVSKVQQKYNEIKEWTVVVPNGEGHPVRVTDRVTINATRRSLEPSLPNQTYFELNRRRISSGSDEFFDLDQEQLDAALEQTNHERRAKGKGDTQTPSPHSIRMNRSKSTALLILYFLELSNASGESPKQVVPGFMISFPELGHREMDKSFWANVVYARNGQEAEKIKMENNNQND